MCNKKDDLDSAHRLLKRWIHILRSVNSDDRSLNEILSLERETAELLGELDGKETTE